jgi:hypothetical protein
MDASALEKKSRSASEDKIKFDHPHRCFQTAMELWSMQPLMYDQPQPTRGRIENNSTKRGGANHHTS